MLIELYNSTREQVYDENKEKTMEQNTKRKVSVEELNELSIVGGDDGNPEPRCSISNIIITTVLVSLVSISYFTTSPEQCKLI